MRCIPLTRVKNNGFLERNVCRNISSAVRHANKMRTVTKTMIRGSKNVYNGNTMIIGVAGGTGSGKTTLARHIANAFGDRVAVITHDSYYRAQDDKTLEERALQNYDHPDAFETELLCKHLEMLASGQAVDVPVYDYTIHNRSKATTRVEPKSVIVLEGILLFRPHDLLELALVVLEKLFDFRFLLNLICHYFFLLSITILTWIPCEGCVYGRNDSTC